MPPVPLTPPEPDATAPPLPGMPPEPGTPVLLMPPVPNAALPPDPAIVETSVFDFPSPELEQPRPRAKPTHTNATSRTTRNDRFVFIDHLTEDGTTHHTQLAYAASGVP